jgi:ArsR family transcriptional regulator
MNQVFSFDHCAEKLRALGDSDRLQIVQELRRGEKNVTQLVEALGAEMSNVSHHLQVLRGAGLVETRKDGRFVVYRLHPSVLATADSALPLDLGCCRLELPK